MEILISKYKNKLTVAPKGRLDAMTAPELEEKLKAKIDGVENLVFDFAELTYISSAGLRVLMIYIQLMEEQGSVVIKNVCKEVMDVFEVTGLTEFLNIE